METKKNLKLIKQLLFKIYIFNDQFNYKNPIDERLHKHNGKLIGLVFIHFKFDFEISMQY